MPFKKGRRGSRWWTRATLVVVVVIAAVILTGCGGSKQAETPIDPNVTAIAGAPPMPDWLMKADPLIKTEYIWASSHMAELQYIPCYCGCAGEHKDNFACYYQRNENGGIADYDGMAAG